MKKVRLTQRITTRETESFKKYLEEIREISKFEEDEEYEAALKATQTKDLKVAEAAKEELIKRNLRFVVSVAKQYVSQENTLEDLVNEGNIGLIKAARRFEPDRGYKFITYAVWWIRRDILSYINENARLVRLPNNKLSLLTKLKDEVNALEQVLERAPSVDEILEFTNDEYDEKDVKFFLLSEKEHMYSFDKPVQEEDSQTLMSDLFEDETYGYSDQLLNLDDSKYNIKQMLGKLKNDNQRQVLTLLYGLNGDEEQTITKVGEEMDLTRERVRQIKVQALKRLKKVLSEEKQNIYHQR